MPSKFNNRPFDKLKKRITNSTAQSPPASSPLPKPITDNDLFSDAMRDVQEIPEFRVLPCVKTQKHATPARERSDPDAVALSILKQIADGKLPINLSDTQEYVEWTNPGMHEALTAELHTGRFSVQAMLDLHGFTGGAVNEEIDAFLREAFKRDWLCVKIIHGRGLRSVRGPVLKNAVIRRLLGRYREQVIAFVSARQCDGGLGALYVLLQQR
jgi:DNA-nicking Smr family endonuclease